MTRLYCVALLLFAVAAVAQEPRTPPPQDTPQGREVQPVPTPEQRAPGFPDRMPPDTRAPAHHLSTEQVQAAIQDKLATEPILASTGVKALVDEKSVVLTGTVENDDQHELALRIASSYAGDREIVDNLETRTRL